MKIRLLVCGMLLSFGVTAAEFDRTPSPDGATVYLISPVAGAEVTSPVHVVFGLRGMGVAPAGANVPNTGHHHLIVDAPFPDLNAGVPADANHIHFGGGQTEADVELEPGEHTLRLILADYRHIPHDPPICSVPVKITVSAP